MLCQMQVISARRCYIGHILRIGDLLQVAFREIIGQP